jgi:hypothetical protein
MYIHILNCYVIYSYAQISGSYCIEGCYCTEQRVPSDPLNVQLCSYYLFVCIECDLRFVSSTSVLEFGVARQNRFPWEEAVKASLNT